MPGLRNYLVIAAIWWLRSNWTIYSTHMFGWKPSWKQIWWTFPNALRTRYGDIYYVAVMCSPHIRKKINTERATLKAQGFVTQNEPCFPSVYPWLVKRCAFVLVSCRLNPFHTMCIALCSATSHAATIPVLRSHILHSSFHQGTVVNFSKIDFIL